MPADPCLRLIEQSLASKPSHRVGSTQSTAILRIRAASDVRESSRRRSRKRNLSPHRNLPREASYVVVSAHVLTFYCHVDAMTQGQPEGVHERLGCIFAGGGLGRRIELPSPLLPSSYPSILSPKWE